MRSIMYNNPLVILPFGKYKGETLQIVWESDKEYVVDLLNKGVISIISSTIIELETGIPEKKLKYYARTSRNKNINLAKQYDSIQT